MSVFRLICPVVLKCILLYSKIGNILTATEGYSIITQSVKDLNNPPKSFILQTTTEPIGYYIPHKLRLASAVTK